MVSEEDGKKLRGTVVTSTKGSDVRWIQGTMDVQKKIESHLARKDLADLLTKIGGEKIAGDDGSPEIKAKETKANFAINMKKLLVKENIGRAAGTLMDDTTPAKEKPKARFA